MSDTENNKSVLQSLIVDLEHLKSVYQRLEILNEPGRGSALTPLAREILFCSALLRNVIGRKSVTFPVGNVVVFGGTQVGKSAVVNIISGNTIARVHHTAGFTRHAHGFVYQSGNIQDILAGFPYSFPDGHRIANKQQWDLEPFENYSVEIVSNKFAPPFDNKITPVLWDAPDCDAVDSNDYLVGVLETVTIADVLVYVTTREKYAIRHILEWVLKMKNAGIPVLSCLNMTPKNLQEDICKDMDRALKSIADKHGFSAFQDSGKIIALEYLPDGNIESFYSSESSAGEELRNAVSKGISQSIGTLKHRKIAAFQYVTAAVPQILVPAKTELDAAELWESEIQAGIEQFISDYKTGYLNNDQRFDAFNRVGLEILALLNPPIPGLEKTLKAVRTVLSLPAKAIIWGSKVLWKQISEGNSTGQKKVSLSSENQAFEEAHERFINKIKRKISDNRKQHPNVKFWNNLDLEWDKEIVGLMPSFRRELEQHKRNIDRWSKETAQAIYTELEKEPIKLNILRTGRIAADAGAIIISVKTGGAGDLVHDIVVAPALMSVVEAVSRQLTGNYVERKKSDFKESLVSDTEKMVRNVHGKQLTELGMNALGSVGIGPDERDVLKSFSSKLEMLKKHLENSEQKRD